jgi:plasmid maintenance system antidote protein VapI
MSADFWLGLQQDWDLWQAMHRPEARAIKPLVATAKSISA